MLLMKNNSKEKKKKIHFFFFKFFRNKKSLKMIDPDLMKCIAAALIGISTVLGCVFPMCFKAQKWTSRAESLAGGVFLGAGLAHLLQEAFEDIDDSWNTRYPVAPAVCLVTFVILTCVQLFSYSEHDEQFVVETNRDELLSSLVDGTTSFVGDDSYDPNQALTKFGKNYLTVPTLSLYLIMDIHSMIEGIALGILKDATRTLAIFLAIIGHKPIEAFALALILLKDKPYKALYWVLIAFYSLLTPVGIIAGMWISNHSNNAWKGIISAFSAGTFLFVGCSEWGEMFEHKVDWSCGEKSWHYFMFVTGLVWMLLIAIAEAIYG